MAIRTCPACGSDSPADRPRCYNCNTSLEREPIREGPRTSEAPTEKRQRPAVDLWKQDYTPPAEKVNVEPAGDDGSGTFNRSKIVRGGTGAEADQFQPQRRAGRGSSGDPSEIAPPKKQTGSIPAMDPTPSTRVRPKSDTGDVRGGPGSGSYALRGRPPVEPPVADGPLLEPNRRSKPPTGSFEAPAVDTPRSQGPPGRPPADVLDAVQAANEAARSRKRIDPSDVAQFQGALDDFGGASSASEPASQAPKGALAETAADENPGAMAQAKVPPADPSAGPHMPHYLVTPLLSEPVALARNQVVRIGRGEDNEIIFPLSQVSRHHAEVRFDGQAGAYVIIDRNSINGTFVNGKSIKRRRLADGDRIVVGPFTIVYRVSTGGHKLRAMDETDVIRPGSLAGELADMPIADVVRFIELLKKTGELTVIAQGGDRGTMIFRDGQPIHAEFKVTLGPQAAVGILRIKAGNFRFAVKPIEVAKPTIAQPLGVLLNEAGNPG